MERGVRSPTIRSLVKLAEVLEIAPSEVLRRMEASLNEMRNPKKARR